MNKLFYFFLFLLASANVLLAQENQVELMIEPLGANEAYDIKGGEGCKPGDIVVTIKSDVKNLFFDSNVIDIENISYSEAQGEYVFCHSKESFWLTIGSDKHISKKTYIDGMQQKYAFKVVEKAAVGKVLFNTQPNNALVDFGFEGQSPQLSGAPIEINSGEYNVRISKHGYMPVDTFAIVPSSGNLSQLDIKLKPTFAKIQIDIKAADNSEFQILPTIEIDTARINMGELLNKNKLKSFDDEGRLQYFKLYKGGMIPVPDGAYTITVSAPSFRPYSTRLVATKGVITPFSVSLEPITGYLTVLDNGNAIGAKVLVDNELVGTVPLYKKKVKVGQHIVSLQKEGYISDQEEYTIFLNDSKEVDLPVQMTLFKRYVIKSNPVGAEILVDGQRQGFTPFLLSIAEGQHKIELRKHGYLDHKQYLSVKEIGVSIDTLEYILEKNTPLYINSEIEGLDVFIKRAKDTVFAGKTPVKIGLPLGRYTMTLYNSSQNCFKGPIKHNGKNKIEAPCYSRGTFTLLVADYFPNKPLLKNEESNHLYRLLGTAQFGRFTLLPGLSTSIAKASLFEIDNGYKDTETTIVNDKTNDTIQFKYPNYIPAFSFILLSAEVRIGVPILKSLDISALGTYTFYPDITKYIPSHHVSGHDIFVGLELSSRLSVFNMNIKVGSKMLSNISYNFYTKTSQNLSSGDETYSKYYYKVPANLEQFVVSIGFTLGQNRAYGNNMLRVLKKPLFTHY